MNLWAETKCSSAFGDRESYALVRLLESKIENENFWNAWMSGMREIWWRSGIAETERERDGIAERERDGMFLMTVVFVCVTVGVTVGDKWAMDIESYKLDIHVAPPGFFLQLGFAKTP